MLRGADRVAVVVEDDVDLRDLVETVLSDAGFTCHTTDSGLTAIELIRTLRPVLTTLDVGLPGIDGLEVARRIRAFSDTYIIMLSARDEEIDVLMGLDAGADDYLTKPFRPRELRARVEAMLRRERIHSAEVRSASGPPPVNDLEHRLEGGGLEGGGAAPLVEPAWLCHNGLRVNPEMRLCELQGEALELTRSEFALLVAIMLGERRVISKSSLALDMRERPESGEYVSESDQRVVESHLAHLRRKLNDPVSAPRFIETVRGVGYRLTAPQS